MTYFNPNSELWLVLKILCAVRKTFTSSLFNQVYTKFSIDGISLPGVKVVLFGNVAFLFSRTEGTFPFPVGILHVSAPAC